MKKLNCISSSVISFAWFLLSNSLFAQIDPGERDTLFVSSPCNTVIVASYHDESLSGIAIPLKYKNPQTDIFLDSVRFHPNLGSPFLMDTVIDRNSGTVVMFAIWTDSLASGVDTFFIAYFTIGPTWDPSVYNPIDTFRLESGQGLSFAGMDANDITPHYYPPTLLKGCLDVKDDHRFPSTLRPSDFSLSQNFPNPFNTETVITFALPHSSHVRIEIFNILGQKVRDLADEKVSAGYKKVVWDGKDNGGKAVASGVYFYRVKTDNFVDVKKMTLLK